MKTRSQILTSHKKEIIKDTYALLDNPARRLLGKRSLTLGAISLLTGCTMVDEESIEESLKIMSRFNDKAQALLFSNSTLAPEYTLGEMTSPFPFNAYYTESEIRPSPKDFKLILSGKLTGQKIWALEQLQLMPQVSQITRHICVEGWSAIGQWGGVRFSDFLERVGADKTAAFIGFKCHDDYYTSIDMPTALHPQTLLALTFAGQPLPAKYGYPLKLRMPTKLGYKNPKYIQEIYVTNQHPGGYWEDQGYNWFGGS
jgi:DMSO/TMAO reductase YedYZ molybdopterin-dependent catalytic subunit